MPSSGTLCCVALVGRDISEERIVGVTRIGKVETMLAVTSNRSKLRRNNN
jgi:hypothetical protein